METVEKRKRTGKKKVMKKKAPESPVVNTDDATNAGETSNTDNGFKVPLVENRDGIPVPALTREHLLEAELLLSKITALQAESKSLNSDAQIEEQNATLRIRALRHEGSQKAKKAIEMRIMLNSFWDRMGTLYGIDFKHAGYDDQTGIITIDPRHNQDEKT